MLRRFEFFRRHFLIFVYLYINKDASACEINSGEICSEIRFFFDQKSVSKRQIMALALCTLFSFAAAYYYAAYFSGPIVKSRDCSCSS